MVRVLYFLAFAATLVAGAADGPVDEGVRAPAPAPVPKLPPFYKRTAPPSARGGRGGGKYGRRKERKRDRMRRRRERKKTRKKSRKLNKERRKPTRQRLPKEARPKPDEIEQMENWWCDGHPESVACTRKTFHALEGEARKEAARQLRVAMKTDKRLVRADRKDIDDMHRAWCKQEGGLGGFEHASCKAWLFSRGLKKDEL